MSWKRWEPIKKKKKKKREREIRDKKVAEMISSVAGYTCGLPTYEATSANGI